MALLTFGEGYHNYHHAFVQDYRNGVRWYHFDPGKWVIWILYKLDLAYNLKKVNSYVIKRKEVSEDKRVLLEKLSKIVSTKKEALEHLIQELSGSINNKVNKISILLRERGVKRKEIRALKKSVRRDFASWRKLSKVVVSLI